nr:phage major capsid protein [uncultured Aminipila sp.]
MKTIKELLELRAALLAEIDGANEARFAEIQLEMRKLDLQIAEAKAEEARSKEGNQEGLDENGQAQRTNIVNGVEVTPGVVIAGQQRKAETEDLEKRMNDIAAELRAGKEVTITAAVASFAESRAVASTGLLIENKYKREVAPAMNEISQVIDLVTPVPLDGGSSYSVAFAIDTGDADYSAEAAAYTNDEGTFGTNDCTRAKITNSAIVDEEVIDLPNANYIAAVYDNVRKSIRKKISNQIIGGPGTTNTIKGVKNAPISVMPATYKIEETTIDQDTLLNIVMGYGNDEDVTSPLTLFLNKLTLASFATVKKANGDPYYKISYNGPSGFIEGNGLRVPYSITSALGSHVTATAGDITMIYGDPAAYELAIFGDITIKQSNERYIDKGQVGFFGKTYVGGLVNRYKAFLPVKKA